MAFLQKERSGNHGLHTLLHCAVKEIMLIWNGMIDDDDNDRRQQRRKYEEPLATKVRRQLLTIAESVCLLFSPSQRRRVARDSWRESGATANHRIGQ